MIGPDLCRRYDYKSCKETEDLKYQGVDFTACDYLSNFGLFILGTNSKQDDNVYVLNALSFKKSFKIRGQGIKSPHKLEFMPGGVSSIAVTLDNQYYAIGGENGTIQLGLVR